MSANLNSQVNRLSQPMSPTGSPPKQEQIVQGFTMLEDYFAIRFGIYGEDDSVNIRDRFSSVTSENPLFLRAS